MLANGDIDSLSEAQDYISKHFLEVNNSTFDTTDLNAYNKFLKLMNGES